jgi:DNA-directed RNA polymerase specialized sigma24 family protein
MSEPLRSEQLEALLARLGPDRESAGTQYEQLRKRLISVFEYRRCPHPEELADETLDRTARKLQEMGAGFVGSDPARYVFGVAWNVARESFRHKTPLPLPEKWEKPARAVQGSAEGESQASCLDRCLDNLPPDDRHLVLVYHEGEGVAKIRRRSDLARERGLSPNAMRLKMHRITARLRECILHCLERKDWLAAEVVP